MVALSRCLGSLVALLTGVEGARVARKRVAAQPKDIRTKFIAGVPVLNYHTAYEGESSLGASDGELAGEWVVVVKAGTTDAQMQSLCEVAPAGCNLMGHPEGGVPFLEMRGTESDLERLVQIGKGMVDFIEPDRTVDMIPEIESTSAEAATWGLRRIGVDSQSRFGTGVTVFVLDTGVRITHNEFGGRAASALDMSSGSLVECDGGADCAGDRQGHGTHCAGTAAGATFGVANQAEVRAVKVLSDSGSGQWSWSYEALDWLATSSVRPAIASMSLGGPGVQTGMGTAVDAAVNSGVVVVVAAGNSNSDACNFSPAYIPSAITVGSTSSSDRRSYFSCYGSCVDIWAPGSDVNSASAWSDSDTDRKSGTSMACPHVSGGAAMVLEASPTSTSSAVLAELMDRAVMDSITDLRDGDTNALLFVGGPAPPNTTAAPTPATTPAPTPAPTTPAPTPAPTTPAPTPGSWEITSGTGCTMIGNCIQSKNHPAQYGNREACTINALGVDLTVDAFNTESNYDYLSMDGKQYSGTSGPPSGMHTGEISWSSDISVTKSGWKLCKA